MSDCENQDEANRKSGIPKSSANRRRLLKTIGAGGGVIVIEKSVTETWVTPQIETIMLPVHANTTPKNTTTTTTTTTTTPP